VDRLERFGCWPRSLLVHAARHLKRGKQPVSTQHQE
jgi:hypothetical protein